MTIIQVQRTKNPSIKVRRTRNQRSQSSLFLLPLLFLGSVLIGLAADKISNLFTSNFGSGIRAGRSSDSGIAQRPPACTEEQRSKVLQQLTPDKCTWDTSKPWYQRCSFTQATKQSDSTWLKSYYEALHKKNGSTSTSNESNDKFVAVFVGCNMGYDAVDALRMGSADGKYNKDAWAEEIEDMIGEYSNNPLSDRSEFPLDDSSSSNDHNDAIVYCIDHSTALTASFRNAAFNLGWSNNFHVIDGAVSNIDGLKYFLKSTVEANERHDRAYDEKCRSMKEESQDAFEKNCLSVRSAPLDVYLEEEARKGQDGNGRIHLLRINSDGYDYDILMGAKKTLSVTEYLEFQYNWMNSWEDYKLIDAVKMLDDLGFTCYFGGNGNAWRIDESCWLDHYDWHSWANVACVNRLLNKHVAGNLEETFIKTLDNKEVKF
mmetsp:Transcript_5466/g.6712  ORF Transcript_5466/g.6712 Transcript_5466/m.6712 type:complete len:431 (+) Transcript_5466:14-1306(+)